MFASPRPLRVTSAPARRPGAADVRQRGSVMILVVVALVLMCLLGMSYMQVARMDRIATAQLATNNIEIVANSCVAYLSNVLRNDLFDNTTGLKLFDPSEDESYDYPWTNPAYTFQVLDSSGAVMSEQAEGGTIDDTWLASAFPDFTSGNATWPHLSNLTGVYLRLPSSGGSGSPTELPVNNTLSTNTWRRDTNIRITGGTAGLDNTTASFTDLGVDTDGDGVRDAKWTYAPIRQIGSAVYVVAYRVVDLSALINFNTATSLTSDGWSYPTGADTPRGLYPTEIDLSRLLARYSIANWTSGGSYVNEMKAWFAERGVNSASNYTPLGFSTPANYPAAGSYTATTTRMGAWLDRVRHYGNSDNRYSTVDERELRYHGGLNNDAYQSSAEGDAPTLLRASSAESSYTNVTGSLESYFQGGTDATAVKNRVFPSLRNQLTARSAAAIFSPNHRDMHGGTRTLKYDLIYEDGGPDAADPSTRLGNIAARLHACFLPPSSTGYLGLGDPTLRQIASEFALMIQDYSDTDATPSYWSDGSTAYYGLELMPFLREVYLEMGYDDVDLDNPALAGPHPNATPDGQFDHWVPQAGSQAMVVEIGNPFDQTIPASLLNGRIRVVVTQGGSTASSYTLSGASSIAPREELLIVSNATAGIDEPVGTPRGALEHSTQGLNLGSYSKLIIPAGSLTFAAGTDVQVELQINTGSSWVSYDRLTVAGFKVPTTVDHMATPTVVRTTCHAQGSIARDGRNHRFISNENRAIITGSVRQPDAGGYRNDSAGNAVDKLGEDNKGVNGSTILDNYQLPLANRPLLNVAELGYLHMFGFSDQPTGDLPYRLSGDGTVAVGTVVNATQTQDTRRWSMTANSELPAAGSIPHVCMVFDEFTTLSPRHDGLDNDNDDGDNDPATGTIDDDVEQVVPGRLNVNTAPLHLLTLGSSLPENLDDVQALMAKVIDYRDNPANRNGTLTANNMLGYAGLRQEKGIASIGELALINPALVASGGGSTGSTDMLLYGPANGSTPPAAVDLYPLPEETGSNPLSSRMSIEEQMMRFQFVAQNLTTRSDVFAAYIYVRGYAAGRFNLGPLESKRFFVIFDRSRLTTGTDQVQIITVQDVN